MRKKKQLNTHAPYIGRCKVSGSQKPSYNTRNAYLFLQIAWTDSQLSSPPPAKRLWRRFVPFRSPARALRSSLLSEIDCLWLCRESKRCRVRWIKGSSGRRSCICLGIQSELVTCRSPGNYVHSIVGPAEFSILIYSVGMVCGHCVSHSWIRRLASPKKIFKHIRHQRQLERLSQGAQGMGWCCESFSSRYQ
jgi:hypothetical protein